MWMRFWLVPTIVLAMATPSLSQTKWQRVNMGWQVSCGVDSGSIRKSRGAYTFATSSNHCTGGIFHQRAELNTRDISVRQRVTYLFETTVAFKSASSEPFVIFQIHDGRDGCSPPMSLRWQGNNTLSFDSDYTRGRGMSGCVDNRSLRSARYTGPRLSRDGRPHKLQVMLDFDGRGSFDVTVFVDGQGALRGQYHPPNGAGFVVSDLFFLKHGVYSQNIWPYQMTSQGMRVLRAKR